MGSVVACSRRIASFLEESWFEFFLLCKVPPVAVFRTAGCNVLSIFNMGKREPWQNAVSLQQREYSVSIEGLSY